MKEIFNFDRTLRELIFEERSGKPHVLYWEESFDTTRHELPHVRGDFY